MELGGSFEHPENSYESSTPGFDYASPIGGEVDSGVVPPAEYGQRTEREVTEIQSPEVTSSHPTNFGEMTNGAPHTVARGVINSVATIAVERHYGIPDIQRTPVPDEQVSWATPYPDYTPVDIDMPQSSTDFAWPDDVPVPADPATMEFTTLEGTEVRRDEDGRPLNPMGRTGWRGRLLLEKWGENEAADVIVSRDAPSEATDIVGQEAPKEVLLVERSDGGWALPGGKVDPGETAWQAAGRELEEETGFTGAELDFEHSSVVYAGYADDNRNSDNAWMATTVHHVHLTPEQARSVGLEAGSDARQAAFVPVTEELYDSLFSTHGAYLRLAFGLGTVASDAEREIS